MDLPNTAQPDQVGIQPRKFLPYLALAAGILALSMSSMFIRWAQAPGTVTSFYRMLVATIALLPVFIIYRRKNPKLGFPLVIWAIPLFAGFFSSLDHAIWSTSLGYTRIANATLLNNISPLWVALFAFFFLKERMNGRFWLGLFLTLSGAVIVFGNDLLANPHLGFGDFLAVVSSLFYAGYFLCTQRGREKMDTLPFIFLACAGSAASLLGINLLLGQPFIGFTPLTWLIFLAAGLISQVVGYFSLVYALGHLPASVVAPSMIGQPVLTAFLAIPFAGEHLSLVQSLGGITVLAGIYLVNRAR